MWGRALANDAENVVLADERELLVVDLHLGAAVLADQHLVADLHLERNGVTLLVLLAGAERDDFSLLGLFLRGIRNDDSPANLFFFLDVLHEHSIADGLDLYFGHMD